MKSYVESKILKGQWNVNHLFVLVLCILVAFGCTDGSGEFRSKYDSIKYIVNEADYQKFDLIVSDVHRLLKEKTYWLDTNVENYFGKPISTRVEKQNVRAGFIVGGDLFMDAVEYKEYEFGVFSYWIDSQKDERYLTKFFPSEKSLSSHNLYYGKTKREDVFRKYGREMYSGEHGGIIYIMRGFNYIFYFDRNEVLEKVEVSFV